MDVAQSTPPIEPLVRVFRALGDETRLRLVVLLSAGELCVCHLVAALDQPQPLVSRHLAVLRGAGLVRSRREGGWAHYMLVPPAEPAIARILRELASAVAEPTLSADLARLRRSIGPDACP